MAVLRVQSDARLAELTASGSERAFEAIVQRYRTSLVRHCRHLLRDREAEDVVQAAFLRAWTALSEGEHVRELRPWLFTIARNGALDVVRRSGYDYDELRESISGVGGPEEEIERRAVVRRTLTGLASLPPAQREALLRVAVDGQSQAQAAEELGLTEGAVRQLVYRARAGLRTAAGAFVPLPVISWAAALGTGSPTVERIAQIASASAPAAAPAAIKAGALLATAAVATAPVAVHHAARHRDGADLPGSSAAVTRAPAASRAPAPVSGVVLRKPVTRSGSTHHDDDRSGRDDADDGAAGEREQRGGSPADDDRDETRHSATSQDEGQRESGGEDSREERAGTEATRRTVSPATTGDDDRHSGESGTSAQEAPEAGGEPEAAAPAPAAGALAESAVEPAEPAGAAGESVQD